MQEETDRMALTLREMDTAEWREKDQDAAAKARELLDIASHSPDTPMRAQAIYQANIMLGKVALHNRDKRTAVRFMLAAADTPGLEQISRAEGYGTIYLMDMNLMRSLVDWGERDAVARFFERVAPKMNDPKRMQDWSAQIRDGINPNLGPTRNGCSRAPC